MVIADEAHRSQYGFRTRVVKSSDGEAADLVQGFAQYLRDGLPNASYIGFTGTPIELTDKNTRAVFGDYISVYDIQRAVDDGATVPIYYESRLAQLSLSEDHRAVIDDEFEEVTEHEEVNRRERLKSRWAALEAVVGDEKRLERIAEDIVRHYEQRTEAIAGKAMIVCMSRRICVAMYQAIRKLRPAWHGDEDDTGAIKVIMTGSAADEKDWQPHIRSRARLDALAKRFRNDKDPLRLVIVRDMWLTGFDAPSLHTSTSTSRCRATDSCRRSPVSTACSATSRAASWSTTWVLASVSGAPSPTTPTTAARARPRSTRTRQWR